MLNDALATEFIGVLRYTQHHFDNMGLSSGSIAAEFLRTRTSSGTTGFLALALAEDHALVDVLTRHGLPICRAGNAPVVTSARKDGRASGEFGTLLNSIYEPDWHLDLARHSLSRRNGKNYCKVKHGGERGRI